MKTRLYKPETDSPISHTFRLGKRCHATSSAKMNKSGDSRSEPLRNLLSIVDFGTTHSDDQLPMFPRLPEEVACHQTPS
jgi:hypothetical protein